MIQSLLSFPKQIEVEKQQQQLKRANSSGTTTETQPKKKKMKTKDNDAKALKEKAAEELSNGFRDDNAFEMKSFRPTSNFTGKITARFMKVLKANGVTVAMQHMKG